MSDSETHRQPLEQTVFQRAELDALRRMLTLSEGTFSLSIAICNSPALRNHIVAHLKEQLSMIAVVRLDKDTTDIFDAVRRQVTNQDRRAVFVADLEKALATEARDRVLQTLNVSRELWRSRYACPVVFWVPEYVAALISTQARDLWSWVSHHFEFVSEQATALAGLQDSFSGDLTAASNLDVHAKHIRIAELEARIADAGEAPEGRLREHALIWLDELAYLHNWIGETEKAEQTMQKTLRWLKSDEIGSLAKTYGNLGAIYLTRGDVDRAEEMYNKSLEIDEKLGRLKGIASTCGNLGVIHRIRGDLDRAEEMHTKSLEISVKLGRLEGMANAYSNLGLIYLMGGDLDRAEEMLRKSLEINERLGRLEGMAITLGNLSLVYKARGDLEPAEEMLGKSLEISEKLGRLDGIAIAYGNLGLIYKARGEGAKARECWTKALGLYERIGMTRKVAQVRGWIEQLSESEK